MTRDLYSFVRFFVFAVYLLGGDAEDLPPFSLQNTTLILSAESPTKNEANILEHSELTTLKCSTAHRFMDSRYILLLVSIDCVFCILHERICDRYIYSRSDICL